MESHQSPVSVAVHLESELSKASGVDASEMEQMLGNASKTEAVLHYMTRF